MSLTTFVGRVIGPKRISAACERKPFHAEKRAASSRRLLDGEREAVVAPNTKSLTFKAFVGHQQTC